MQTRYFDKREERREVIISARNEPWQTLAACAGKTELFFPPEGEKNPSQTRDDRITEAKQLCSKCRVRKQCLQHALGNKEEKGIWGGMTEDERRALMRRRAKRR